MTNYTMPSEFPMTNAQRPPSTLRVRSPALRIGAWAFIGHWTLVIGHLICSPVEAAHKPSPEDQYYQIITLPVPPGIILEAGALQLLPNGKLASATRLGDIYLIEGAFENPPAHLKFHLFASGLHEVLGLAYRDGYLYCTKRGQVT